MISWQKATSDHKAHYSKDLFFLNIKLRKFMFRADQEASWTPIHAIFVFASITIFFKKKHLFQLSSC